jgi:DNA replication protein DnaC
MREHSGRPGVKEGLKAMPFGSLGDIPAATAILDRFLAHATIVPVTGKSYRLRQRASTTDD